MNMRWSNGTVIKDPATNRCVDIKQTLCRRYCRVPTTRRRSVFRPTTFIVRLSLSSMKKVGWCGGSKKIQPESNWILRLNRIDGIDRCLERNRPGGAFANRYLALL